MEESEKTNGRKRLPSIPSNYVTLLQLQERWNNEKERKQKEKGEIEEPQQQQEDEKETRVKERVNGDDSGRGSRKNGRFPRINRDNGMRVAKGKPGDEKSAAAEDLDNEKKREELKIKKKNNGRKKRKKKRRDEMEEKARAANEGEEVKGVIGNAPLTASMEHGKGVEELIGNEVHDPKLASAKEKNVEARRESRPRLIPRTHGHKTEIGRKFQAVEHNKGEVELIGDQVHALKQASVEEENVEAKRGRRPRSIPRTHGRTVAIGRKFQAVEHNKGEEELVGDEVHAPKLVTVEEENVEAKWEWRPRLIPRTHGRTAEIGQKFQAMSVNGEIITGDYRRYGRQNFNFYHRGGNWEMNRRRELLNQRNEGRVWVKKGEVKDQNLSAVQS